MSGLQVTVTITGLTEAQKKFVRLSSDFHDFRAAMNSIGKSGKEYFAGQGWQSEGGVFGSEWPDLSPGYAAWKAKHYAGKGILERSGTMRRSFNHKYDKDSVIISNDAPQFKYHQSSKPRRVIPYRPMTGVSIGFRSLVHDIMEDDVRQKIRKAS